MPSTVSGEMRNKGTYPDQLLEQADYRRVFIVKAKVHRSNSKILCFKISILVSFQIQPVPVPTNKLVRGGSSCCAPQRRWRRSWATLSSCRMALPSICLTLRARKLFSLFILQVLSHLLPAPPVLCVRHVSQQNADRFLILLSVAAALRYLAPVAVYLPRRCSPDLRLVTGMQALQAGP